MRKDILITIDTTTSLVKSNSAVAGVKSENLQGNLIIKPEPFIYGTGRIYINNQGSIEMIKEDDYYILPIKSSLLKNGDFNYCFKITEPETEKGIPVFCSEISDMQVLDSIADETEIPEQYPTWIETFDSKIAEVEKLEQTVSENEKARETAETTRATEESKRAQNETERKSAEEARAKNEQTRTESIDNLAKQMPWNTTEISDSLHIEDAFKYNQNQLIPFGNMKQETRTGKNLVDFSKYAHKSTSIDYSFVDDIITATQTGVGSYASVSFSISDVVQNNPSKILKFVFKSIDVSNFTSTNKIIVQIEVTDNGTKTYRQVLDKNNTTATYTIPDDTSNVTSATLNIFTNNSTDTIETSTIKITKPMLLFSTETDESYEKYGAMPSFEFESMPQRATGVQKITKCQKNKLNTHSININLNGLNFKSTNDGAININGAKTEGTITYTVIKTIKSNSPILKSNEKHFFSYKKTASTTIVPFAWLYDCNGKIIHNITGSQFNKAYAFSQDIYMIKIGIEKIEIGTTYDEDIYIQIEEGDTATDYEPYTEKIFALDLENKELVKIVDSDENVIAQDNAVHREQEDKTYKWQWAKDISKAVFNGIDIEFVLFNNNLSNVLGFRVRATYSLLTSNTYFCCDKLKTYTESELWNGNKEGICYSTVGNYFAIYIKKSRLDGYDDSLTSEQKNTLFNKFLQNNNVTIFYVATETIYEDCTESQSAVLEELQKLALEDGVNNLFVEAETGVPIEIQVTYMQNLNSKYVQKVEGKDLSTCDFTEELKTKLEGLENYNDSELKNSKADKINYISTTETTVTIEPNKFYDFGTAETLNITLAEITDTSILNEYMFQFKTGTLATALTFTDSIEWVEDITILPDKTYQISIINNVGIMLEV